MIVYILTDYHNDTRLEHLTSMIPAYCKCNVKVVTNIDNLDINKDVIISTSVEGQFPIFKKFVKNNVYEMLNDKVSFYNFLKKNPHLIEEIELIPSYDHSYKGPTITKDFLIKQKDGWSSKYNDIVNANIYHLIEKYAITHQIQDIIDVKHIFGVSLTVLFGKILGIYSYKSFEGLTPELNLEGFSAIRGNTIRDVRIRLFLKKIIKKLNFYGIIEFEFLIDKNDKLYIMECNPRISGSLRVSLYFNNIIKTYINAIHTQEFNGINIDDETLWKEYK